MTNDPAPPSPEPSGAHLSPDGKHYWDGQAWQPIPAAESPRKRRPVALFALGGVALAIVALVGYNAMANSETRLEAARFECSAGVLGDSGKTMTLDMVGEDGPSSGLYEFSDVACVLVELGVPDSVYEKMMSTTSLDGRQTDDWDGIEASWKYHPDNGLDIVLELE
jgi:hypothetical protein